MLTTDLTGREAAWRPVLRPEQPLTVSGVRLRRRAPAYENDPEASCRDNLQEVERQAMAAAVGSAVYLSDMERAQAVPIYCFLSWHGTVTHLGVSARGAVCTGPDLAVVGEVDQLVDLEAVGWAWAACRTQLVSRASRGMGSCSHDAHGRPWTGPDGAVPEWPPARSIARLTREVPTRWTGWDGPDKRSVPT
jgi:hypothetical protein